MSFSVFASGYLNNCECTDLDLMSQLALHLTNVTRVVIRDGIIFVCEMLSFKSNRSLHVTLYHVKTIDALDTKFYLWSWFILKYSW